MTVKHRAGGVHPHVLSTRAPQSTSKRTEVSFTALPVASTQAKHVVDRVYASMWAKLTTSMLLNVPPLHLHKHVASQIPISIRAHKEAFHPLSSSLATVTGACL